MILKEFRELRRDRRTLGMLVAMPLLLLVIFGYAASFNVETVKTAIVGAQAEQLASTLPTSFFDVTVTDPSGDQAYAEQLLQDAGLTAEQIAADVEAQVRGARIPIARPE